MKKLVFLFIFLLSGLAMAQTTVTLEDQCNCEVLSGTSVTAAGMTTPSGADVGDIYVNTNTGTIYYWDGGSWELTSTDSQQLQGFTFDTASGELVLTLENGGTASIVLPVQTLTSLTLNGNTLEYLDEDNTTNTIPLNVANLVLGADGNSLDYTDEAGMTSSIPLNVGSLTFAPATRELTYTDEEGASTVIALPADTLTTITGTLALGNAIGTYENENGDLVTINETITSISDAGDGNITFTNEVGNTQTVAKSVITAKPDGTFTFDNGDGSAVTFVGTDNQNAAQVLLSPNLDVDGDSVDETNVQDAITDLAANSSDNQNLTAVTLNGANQLQVDIERGSSASVDLSSLVETIVGGTGAISVADDGNGNYTVTSTDPDEDETNEIQAITSTDGSVALTKTGEDYDLSVAAADGTETRLNSGTNVTVTGDGSTATPYVVGVASLDDADASPTNEIQDLDLTGDILTITNNAGATDIDLSAYANSDTQDLSIDAAGTTISLVDGGSVTVDVDDADADSTNELQDAGEVGIADTAGNFTATQVEGALAELAASDAADLDRAVGNETVTSLAFDGTTLTLSEGGNTDKTVNLGTVNTDDQDLGNTLITANESVRIDITDGTGTTIDIRDADADPTNEIQDLDLTGDILTITNNAGATDIDLSAYANSDTQDLSIDAAGTTISLVDGGSVTVDVDDADADSTNELQDAGEVGIADTAGNFTATQVEGALAELAASDAADLDRAVGNETVTSLAFDGTTLTLSEGGNTDKTVNLGTVNTDNQAISSSVATANETVNIALERGGAATIDIRDADADPTNEIQAITSTDGSVALTKTGEDYDLSVAAADGTETRLNAGANVTVTGNGSLATPYVVGVASLDDADADPANEIQDLDLTGDILTITNNDGATDIDLSAYANSDTQDLSIDAAGTTISLVDGGSVTVDVDDADADPTNEIQTITSTDGSVALTKTGEDYDLSVAAADGSETAVNGGTDISVTGNGTSGNPYVVNSTFTEVDGSTANEIQAITSTDGSVSLTKTGEDYDLSVAAADGTETRLNAGANVTVTGNGSLATPYVVGVASLDDADADPANEIQDLDLTGDILTITNNAGATDIDLSAYANSDTQDLSIDAAGTTISLVDGGSVTVDVDDADADPTNEIQTITSTDGSVALTKTGEDYDLSVAAADGSETAVNGGADISVTGNGTSGSPYVVNSTFTEVDGSTANEIQTITSTDGSVALTKTGEDYDLSVAAADGTETRLNAGANVTVTGNGSLATPYVVGVASLDDADANPTNEIQSLSIDAAGTTISLVDGGSVTVNVDDADAVIGNETVTSLSFDGAILTLNEGGNTPKTVTLSSVSTDNQKADVFSLVGTTLNLSLDNDAEATKTVDLSGFATDAELAASDAADLDKVIGNEVTNATNGTLTRSGTGNAGSPYTLGVSNGGIGTTQLATNAVTNGKIANNAVTTTKILSGGNDKVLTTGATGTVTWENKSAFTDDQTASEVVLDNGVDVDGDNTVETTLENAVQDMAPIVSKAARIFYPPSIAVDASTTGAGRTINLYAQYTAQFATPAVASTGAPAAIPTYAAGDLYYYVTYYDTSVFGNVSVDASGVMFYDVVASPSDYNSLINVVFVVK